MLSPPYHQHAHLLRHNVPLFEARHSQDHDHASNGPEISEQYRTTRIPPFPDKLSLSNGLSSEAKSREENIDRVQRISRK